MKCYRKRTESDQSANDSWCETLLSVRGSNHQRFADNPKWRGTAGFTLIELMIVMSIIAILLAVAIPTYSHSIVAARERVLRNDLSSLREAIWKYTLDKQKAPQSLDDLKTANYIDKIPDDPITHEPNWEVVQDEVLLSIDQQDPGITDVHSASNATASDGTSYSTW